MSTNEENPYKVLGVRADASPQEIKSAYRKLALRYHPDKAKDKAQANEKFAQISHAYEILSDPNAKQIFDQQQQSASNGNRRYSAQGSFRRDDFFFHDPFQVFQNVFREEFGGGPSNLRGNVGPSQRDPFFDSFPDPFARNSGMFGGGLFGGSLFGGMDPFQERGYPDSNLSQDPFFHSPFRGMMDLQRPSSSREGGQVGNRSVFSSSTSSRSFGGGNGESVSVSTTTRIVNGRQQTVTERVVRKADGTIERTRETSGDEGLLDSSNGINQMLPPSTSSRLKRSSSGTRRSSQDDRKKMKNIRDESNSS